jgi:hypothetical protein
MHITQLHWVQLKGRNTTQTDFHEMEPNPSKDIGMHEGNIPLF